MINPNDYTWLKIEPVDAWFFRDGRPSNRGEDQSDLESEFPPNASTVVGALRAALARSRGWNGRGSWCDQLKADDNATLGDGFDNLGQLSFLGPLLMQRDELQRDELLWPMPRHVAGHMVDGRFVPVLLLAPSDAPVATDIGSVHLPMLPDRWKEQQARVSGLSDQQRGRPPEPRSDLWVTSRGMSKILSGQVPEPADCRQNDELFALESRIGIHRPGRPNAGLEGEHTDEAGPSMYSPRYVRLKPGVALVSGIRGLPPGWPALLPGSTVPGLMPLGGESRLAGVEMLEHKPKFPETAPAAGHSVVIAVTPARFADPWWGADPGDDAGKLSPELSGRVVTAALDRPRLMGGWNSVKGQPRPLAPFAAPGTVWWIRQADSAVSGLLQLGDNLQTQYGNGLALVAGSE